MKPALVDTSNMALPSGDCASQSSGGRFIRVSRHPFASRLRRCGAGRLARIAAALRRARRCTLHCSRVAKSSLHQRSKSLPNTQLIQRPANMLAEQDPSSLPAYHNSCVVAVDEEPVHTAEECTLSEPEELDSFLDLDCLPVQDARIASQTQSVAIPSGCAPSQHERKSLLTLLVEFQKTSLACTNSAHLDGHLSDTSSYGLDEESTVSQEPLHLSSTPPGSIGCHSVGSAKRTIPIPTSKRETCCLVDDEFPFVHLFW